MNPALAAAWYDQFGTAPVSVGTVADAAFRDPGLRLYVALVDEVPRLRSAPTNANLIHWLLASEGRVVEAAGAPHRLTHVGRKWRLVPLDPDAAAPPSGTADVFA